MFTLKKWDPFIELTTIHRDMDELFRRTFGALKPAFMGTEWLPAVESYMDKGKLFIKADLPGVAPADVDIELDGRHLTIKGERKTKSEVGEGKEYFSELCYGSFERSMTLPDDVEVEEIHASFSDGVLIVTMPAKETGGSKKVHVEVKEAVATKGHAKKAA